MNKMKTMKIKQKRNIQLKLINIILKQFIKLTNLLIIIKIT